MSDEWQPWEIVITDVFDISGRNGVAIVGTWLVEGEVRSGSAAMLTHEGQAARVDNIGVDIHQPGKEVALFLPGRTKGNVVAGDRLSSAAELS